MPCIAFPLRLEGGLLKRCSEQEAIAAVVEAMARTPGGSWAGSSSFGLRDLLEEARFRPLVIPSLVSRLNRGLADLGLTSYRVEVMEREPSATRGVDSYVLTLAPEVGGPGHQLSLEF